jgi:penicillin-binding protein 1A
VVQGGSTITQQVAKSFFLTPQRKLTRKLKEIFLALKLERNLTKEEILYLYLNQIYFGRGAYGLKSASRVYFRKDPKDLTVAESALLAGLPRSPHRGAPHRDPEYARSRALYVLEQMKKHGWLKEEEYQKAIQETIPIVPNPSPFWQAPYEADLVRQWLVSTFGEDAVRRGGLVVYTTFDLELSRMASYALREGLRELEMRSGLPGPSGHLEETEWDRFLASAREELLEGLFQRTPLPAVAMVGPRSYRVTMANLPLPVTALVTPDMSFPGIVTGSDPKGEVAYLLTPCGTARLPRFSVERFAPYAGGSSPNLMKKIFRRGDVLRVRPLPLEDLKDPKDPRKNRLPLWNPQTPGALVVDLDPLPVTEGAILSVLPDTGEILVAVGGKDYRISQFHRAFQAVRQPGSAFKPIVYAAAIERGFTPVTRVSDNPLVYQDLERETQWKPKNFEEKFFGDLLLYQALALSRNVVTLQIATRIGMDPILEMAKRLGIEGELPRNLTIALGSQGVTLRELVRVYSVFATLGKRPDLYFVREVWDLRGNRLFAQIPPKESELFPFRALKTAPPPANEARLFSIPSYSSFSPREITGFPEVLSPPVAYSMTFLLRQVVERGTGWRVRVLGRPVAGKTGTTDNYNDAWFIGYLPGIVTGVWVGRDDAQSLGKGEVGGKSAAPIWLKFMNSALEGKPVQDFPVPEGIYFEKIDPLTGKPAGILSEKTIWVPFIEGIVPGEFSQEVTLPVFSIDPFSEATPSSPPQEEEEF